MAINYSAKLFETETVAKAHTMSIASPAKAGSLIVMALTGKRSGAYLNLSSIIDSNGNVWAWRSFQSQFRTAIVAWTRTVEAMPIAGTWIGITWNGTPTYSWKSCHSFEGAGAVPIDRQTNSGTSSTASDVISVSGSDWLTFGVVMLPDATSGGLSLLNSAISRDDNGHSGTTPWAECFSRNGTTGSSYTFGATLPKSQAWSVCGVSFPFLAMPASPARVVAAPTGI